MSVNSEEIIYNVKKYFSTNNYTDEDNILNILEVFNCYFNEGNIVKINVNDETNNQDILNSFVSKLNDEEVCHTIAMSLIYELLNINFLFSKPALFNAVISIFIYFLNTSYAMSCWCITDIRNKFNIDECPIKEEIIGNATEIKIIIEIIYKIYCAITTNLELIDELYEYPSWFDNCYKKKIELKYYSNEMIGVIIAMIILNNDETAKKTFELFFNICYKLNKETLILFDHIWIKPILTNMANNYEFFSSYKKKIPQVFNTPNYISLLPSCINQYESNYIDINAPDFYTKAKELYESTTAKTLKSQQLIKNQIKREKKHIEKEIRSDARKDATANIYIEQQDTEILNKKRKLDNIAYQQELEEYKKAKTYSGTGMDTSKMTYKGNKQKNKKGNNK